VTCFQNTFKGAEIANFHLPRGQDDEISEIIIHQRRQREVKYRHVPNTVRRILSFLRVCRQHDKHDLDQSALTFPVKLPSRQGIQISFPVPPYVIKEACEIFSYFCASGHP
jgi:hypothetical protein